MCTYDTHGHIHSHPHKHTWDCSRLALKSQFFRFGLSSVLGLYKCTQHVMKYYQYMNDQTAHGLDFKLSSDDCFIHMNKFEEKRILVFKIL